jgi:hypothetical protein
MRRKGQLVALVVVVAAANGCSFGGEPGTETRRIDDRQTSHSRVKSRPVVKMCGDHPRGFTDLRRLGLNRFGYRCPKAKARPFDMDKFMSEWGAHRPNAKYCKDVTSIDYNWQNDMVCFRPDGSQFLTDYQGAWDYLGYSGAQQINP